MGWRARLPGVWVERFLDIALSFPTLILSLLLLVAVGYWLLSLLGLLDLEVLDLPDGAGVGDGAGLLSALMLKFGFSGLPFGLIYTTLVSLAWLACYFIDYLFLGGLDSSVLRLLAGVLLTPLLLFLALPFAGLLLQPMRKVLTPAPGRDALSLLGELVRVRSPEVDEAQGVAEYDDGAAGLILQVRAAPGQFRRGDVALIVDYLAARHAYRIAWPATAPDSVVSGSTHRQSRPPQRQASAPQRPDSNITQQRDMT